VSEISTLAIEGFRADDPVARLTEWGSSSSTGGGLSSHRLVRAGPGRMELKPTGSAIMLYLFFLVVGLVLVAMGLFGSTLANRWGYSLVGLPFALAGGWLLFSGTVPMVFDKRSGRFSREARSSPPLVRHMAAERSAALGDIHALQLLATWVEQTDSSDYFYYELNLVLRDGARVRVVTYGEKDRIRADARALSIFLGRPVWDAIV